VCCFLHNKKEEKEKEKEMGEGKIGVICQVVT
jgi:hypothetical protein